MTDLEIAKQHLKGHTLCLCRGGDCITDDARGVKPMLRLIASGTELKGYSAADIIVGKAAALLFVKCGITAVFAKTLSKGGKQVLEAHDIPYEYETLVEKILNRAGTDSCPMEKAVADTADPEEGYKALVEQVKRMQAQ